MGISFAVVFHLILVNWAVNFHDQTVRGTDEIDDMARSAAAYESGAHPADALAGIARDAALPPSAARATPALPQRVAISPAAP